MEALVNLGRLPNLRELVIPDPGYSIIDMDLKRADMWVTAWEADDASFKQQLRDELDDPTKDVHEAAAIEIFGQDAYNVIDSDLYKEEGPINKQKRRYAKVLGHGSNYGMQPATAAKQCGISLKIATAAQAKWFAAHPGLPVWHERIRQQVRATRTVYNKFGYRMRFFDRPDNCINEALAWVPQSSVALVINHALCNIEEQLPKVQVLLQVHDSLTMQVRTELVQEYLPQIEQLSLITIPYSDPLTIPVGFSVSDKSWGDVKEWVDEGGIWGPKQ